MQVARVVQLQEATGMKEARLCEDKGVSCKVQTGKICTGGLAIQSNGTAAVGTLVIAADSRRSSNTRRTRNTTNPDTSATTIVETRVRPDSRRAMAVEWAHRAIVHGPKRKLSGAGNMAESSLDLLVQTDVPARAQRICIPANASLRGIVVVFVPMYIERVQL